MVSKFGGIPVEQESTSKFGGIPVEQTVDETTGQKIYKTVKNYLKPVTEGLAMAGGGIVGTATAGPVGGIALGTIGYAGAKEAWEAADVAMGIEPPKNITDELIGSAKNVKEGAEMMLTGEVLGYGMQKAGGKAFNWAKEKISPKIQAGKVLKAGEKTLTIDQLKENVKFGKEIENTIQGVKFTRGQITNDAQAIALERAIIRSEAKTAPGIGKFETSSKELNQEQRAFMERSLQDYYSKKLLDGNVKDFTKILGREESKINTSLKRSEEIINKEVERLSNAIEDQEIGKQLHKRISSISKAVKQKEVAPLWDNIPNESVKVKDFSDDLNTLLAEYNPNITKAENFPNQEIKGFLKEITSAIKKQKLGKKNIDKVELPLQTIIKMRKTITAELSKASKGLSANPTLARNLERIKSSIDNIKISGEAGKAYSKARSAYAKWAKRFKEGTAGDILSKGKRGEEMKVASANVAGKFFTKDGVDDFIRAMGDDTVAKGAMYEFAKFDLYNKSVNKETGVINSTKAFAWLGKNSKVLNKLGIKKEFSEVARKTADLKIAQKKLDLYNKSASAKFLNASPEVAINSAFAGSKNYTQTANELMKAAKGNIAAENGIKKALSDHIFDSSLGAEGFYVENKINPKALDKHIKKFMPALKVFYKNEPEKISALLKINNAYKIASRNLQGIPLSGEEANNFLKTMLAPAIGLATGAKGYWTSRAATHFISKFTATKVNQYLLKATFDPDYAMSLMAIAKSNKPGASQEMKTRTFEKVSELMLLLGNDNE